MPRVLKSMSQDKPFIWKSSLGGPISWVGRVSGDLQGGSNSASRFGGVSDVAPACQLSLDGCVFFNSIVVRLPFNSISDGSE